MIQYLPKVNQPTVNINRRHDWISLTSTRRLFRQSDEIIVFSWNVCTRGAL